MSDVYIWFDWFRAPHLSNTNHSLCVRVACFFYFAAFLVKLKKINSSVLFFSSPFAMRLCTSEWAHLCAVLSAAYRWLHGLRVMALWIGIRNQIDSTAFFQFSLLTISPSCCCCCYVSFFFSILFSREIDTLVQFWGFIYGFPFHFVSELNVFFFQFG